MTAEIESTMKVSLDTATCSAPIAAALIETESSTPPSQRSNIAGCDHQCRKGYKRPRSPTQKPAPIGQLARLVSREFSSDACDYMLSQERDSLGSNSMEESIDDSLLMPPPPSVTGGDYAVHGNLIRATTPSPVREEQETDDDSCAPSYKIYPSAMQVDTPFNTNQQTTTQHYPLTLHETKNNLHTLLRHHLDSIRLEKSLLPLRPLLSRLMSHPTHNRKGLFNKPVDPDALGLYDYRSIITRPMDLGTVKAKLHSLLYQYSDEAVEDIRLVFKNAMTYNPPANPVHIAAKALLDVFESGYSAIDAANHNALPTARVTLTKTPTTVPSPALQHSLPINEINPHISLQTVPTLAPPQAPHALPVHKTRSVQHSCEACKGMTCPMCLQSCLHLEPAVLICNGPSCAGAKIRRGAQYHASPDGSRCWCHRCYVGLSAILSLEEENCHGVEVTRYKRNLIKRKNDEDIVEEWIKCVACQKMMHKVCAMFYGALTDQSNYVCLLCVEKGVDERSEVDVARSNGASRISFISGKELPMEIPTTTLQSKMIETDAQSLSTDPLASFLERKVRERMIAEGCPSKAEQTVTVRTISDCPKEFRVPEVIRRHFHMKTRPSDSTDKRERGSRSETEVSSGIVPPPEAVPYQSKAIALFQRIDGLDICIFCMYVQEYDKTSYSKNPDQDVIGQNKRVYVAYLDSVEHFRPRKCRTAVYQEMLVAYIAASRARGFESAHIWACPPSRGNSFVFWVHPLCQRTPTRDRLEQWYHQALSRAAAVGIITDIKSLYEVVYDEKDSKGNAAGTEKKSSLFESKGSGAAMCPPLLDGDYWLEEAVLIYQNNLSRYLKAKPSIKSQTSIPPRHNNPNIVTYWTWSKCPTLQVASLLEHRVFTDPLSLPFQRPVNAAALNLHDYHDVITHPMDLGTVHIRCLLGDYETLTDIARDVELVVQNATRYNPPGHIVHNMALDLRKLFFSELNHLAQWWIKIGLKDPLSNEQINLRIDNDEGYCWELYGMLSMKLGERIDISCALKEKYATDCNDQGTPQGTRPVETNTRDVRGGDQKEVPCDMTLTHQEISSQSYETASHPISLSTYDTSLEHVQPIDCDNCPPTRDGYISQLLKSSSPCHASLNISPAKRPREEDSSDLSIPKPVSTIECSSQQQAKKRNLGSSLNGTARSPSKLIPPKPDLCRGGPEAVAKRMVGPDTWMLDRKHAHSSCPLTPQANQGSKKKKNGKKKSTNAPKKEDSPPSASPSKGERKESWLGDEVGEVLRRMRRDFYVCDLRPQNTETHVEGTCESPKHGGKDDFESYMEGSTFEDKGNIPLREGSFIAPRIADSRHALLEFSQRSHLQFDTLRRAKYSSAILLYQLHNQSRKNPGLVPSCTSCRGDIAGVRWHKTRRVADDRSRTKTPRVGAAKAKAAHHKEWEPQELCAGCYAKIPNQDDFIPLRVSFRRVHPSRVNH
mmetsp:Transcript_18452/g.26530  ORF Transcript_18452/g.26530 Transcript_18452/m.26530 type:complete len:1452 (+) Transcript_18452:168-4523(+)